MVAEILTTDIKMIKTANAPCSWGVLEFDLQGEAATYEKVLNEIAETGYTGTELGDWDFMPTDPKELKDELTKRKLEMVGAFVPVDFSNKEAHNKGLQTALKTAQLLAGVQGNSPFIILADENGKNKERTSNAGRIKNGMGLTDSQCNIFAEGVNLTAKKVKEEFGLRTVFHHHCAGYVETPEEIKTLLSKTDSNLVGLCLDTGHYMFGGGDPVEAYKNYKDRIWHVHFKDFSKEVADKSAQNNWDYFKSVGEGVFCELGKGAVDFSKMYNELVDNNYKGWIVVEQDVLPGMGVPKECAQRNRDYLKTLGI